MRLRISNYTLTVEPVYERPRENISHYRVTVSHTDSRAVVFEGAAETITEAERVGEQELDRVLFGGPVPLQRRA